MDATNLYNCIIVDDDQIDLLTTLSFVKRYPFLEVKGVYDNPMAALKEIQSTCPAVLLLDIDMEAMSGLELRRHLLAVDACIFITSYPDYALEGFELAALDFLVKPLKADRFEASMRRLEQYMLLRKKSGLLDHSLNGDVLFIKDGHKQIKIKASEILYLEALKDYTAVVTRNRRHCVLCSLGNLLKSPSFDSFIRVHRSYAVQKHFVDSIGSHELSVNGHRVPVGRSYKDALLQIKT